MGTKPALFASLLTLSCTHAAVAQPYGWFSGLNRLTVLNLATGATLVSQPVPAGIQLGDGAIDPITGDYLAITNVGTFRLRSSPPSIAPQVLPIIGWRLRVSHDGTLAVVAQSGSSDWRLLRLSDGFELARYPSVVDASFDPTGIVVVTNAAMPPGPPDYTLHRYALAAPSTPLWTMSFGSTYVRARSDASRTVVTSAAELRVLDALTGAMLKQISASYIVDFAIASSHLYVAYWSEIVKYDIQTLDQLASGVANNFSLRSLAPSKDERQLYAYSSSYGGRLGYITQLVAFDTRDLHATTSRSLLPAEAWLSVGLESVCWFEVNPSPAVGGTRLLTAPARGGVVELRVTAESCAGTWAVTTTPPPYDYVDATLIGPSVRTGSSTIQIAVPPRNTDVQIRLSGYVVTIAGMPYVIQQALETESPLPPVDLRTRKTDSTTTIEWSVDEGPDLTGFRIEAGVAGGPVQFTTDLPPNARAWTAPALPHGHYFAQLRARNAVGNSVASSPAQISVAPSQPPAPPSNLRATSSATSVRLDWDVASLPAASAFVIEGVPTSGPPTVVARTADSRKTFTLSNVQPGNWQYTVRAVNDAGTSAPSNAVSVTTAACSGPPDPPTAVRAVVTENVVTLAWDAPATGADQFAIEVGSVPGASDIARITVAASVTRIDRDVPRGAYVLRVLALSACGQSVPSVERIIRVQ